MDPTQAQPVVKPQSDRPTGPVPFEVVPATPDSIPATFPPTTYTEIPKPTITAVEAAPPRYVAPAVPAAYEPVGGVVYERAVPVAAAPAVLRDDRGGRAVFPILVGLFALVIGGIAGYVIGVKRSVKASVVTTTAAPVTPATGDVAAEINGVLDPLLAKATRDGEVILPTGYPQLDQILGIQSKKVTADLQSQVDLLTLAQQQSAQQVATLQTQITTLQKSLTEAQTQRDDLAAQLNQSGGTTSGLQAQLDAQRTQIATLTADLATTKSQLDAANAATAQARADLQTAKDKLDAANATITQLNLKVLDNYVSTDIAKLRTLATANGWTLIELPVDDNSQPAGTVLDQTPAPGSNMINGSVLYVKVSRKPGP